jgi:hypothetical protein
MRYIIIPGGVVNSFRQRLNGELYELNPLKLHNRNAYAVPVTVLHNPVFADFTPDLGNFHTEYLTREDFEWYHQRPDRDR